MESPLRLPKCQHVFGDHCIKKWFEEADTCPYCRDKVPSEIQVPEQYRQIFRNQARLSLTFSQARTERETAQVGERRPSPDEGSETRRTRARRSNFAIPQFSPESDSSGEGASSPRTPPHRRRRHTHMAPEPPSQPPTERPADERHVRYRMDEVLWAYNQPRIHPEVQPPNPPPAESHRRQEDVLDPDLPFEGSPVPILPPGYAVGVRLEEPGANNWQSSDGPSNNGNGGSNNNGQSNAGTSNPSS